MKFVIAVVDDDVDDADNDDDEDDVHNRMTIIIITYTCSKFTPTLTPLFHADRYIEEGGKASMN